MNVEDTDKYFEIYFEMKWKRDGEKWWAKYTSFKEKLPKIKEDYFSWTSTDQMVDHGWEHSEALYSLLPRFLWCLEEKLKENVPDGNILKNPAELYLLMVSSFSCIFPHSQIDSINFWIKP